ncbi:hypothetical protein KJ693_00305 [bacterium]|nr:hypothetical protein [bacterium]MBU1613732.1 hypothetical protein [bacterium]
MSRALALRELSFESIVDVVESLPPDKKMKLHDILDKGWQEEFDRALTSVRAKMSKFTSEEIDADIDSALAEVRKEKYAARSN